MKTINIKKVIRKIEHIIKGCTDSNKGIGARWGLDKAIKIIKDNIKENSRESYEQIDHYCMQWQKRYGDLLEKYITLFDKCYNLEEKLKEGDSTIKKIYNYMRQNGIMF